MGEGRTPTDVERLVGRIRRIAWQSAPAFAPEADALLAEHARRFEQVVRHFRTTRGWTAFETDVYVCRATEEPSPLSDLLIERLYDVLRYAPVREPVIFNLVAWFFWDGDPELAPFPNPVDPLIELWELGYTTAGGPSDTDERLVLTLGCRAGVEERVFGP